MYLSLTEVSTELVPTALTRQGDVTQAERERALQFVSQALRFALAHNSRRKDADVEAVEQVRPCYIGRDPWHVALWGGQQV